MLKLPCTPVGHICVRTSGRSGPSAANDRRGKPQRRPQARAFTFHEIEGEEGSAEQVDLLGLIKTDRT